MNGLVKNYYDNGVLQSEGMMKDGLAVGVWKFYDPFGKLNQVGKYVLGKKEGRWITGDLGKIKYLGDICLDPDLPNFEQIIKERESDLDIVVHTYLKGISMHEENYMIYKPTTPDFYGKQRRNRRRHGHSFIGTPSF